jgi:hypothetical protein
MDRARTIRRGGKATRPRPAGRAWCRALAAGALAALHAAAAGAAEPITLGLAGFYQQWLVAAGQRLQNGAGDHPFDTEAVDQKHNSEIWFTGRTVLDSGLSIGVEVQLEANTEADQIDESYLFLGNATLGRLELGDTDNAAYKMAVVAPSGGVSVNDGDLVRIQAFALPSGFDPANTTIDTTPLQLTDNDSGKVNFFTPRYAGLQFGFSYIPRFEPGGGDDNNAIARTGGSGPTNNGFAAAVNYRDLVEGIAVNTTAAFLWGDTPPSEGSAPLVGVNLGAVLAVGGVEFGGSFTRATGHAPTDRSLDGHAFDLGIAYEIGPYRVGLTYLRGVSDGSRADGARQYLDQGVLSATYALGPGVALVGGLFVYDANGENSVAGANGVADNQGAGFATGIKLRF